MEQIRMPSRVEVAQMLDRQIEPVGGDAKEFLAIRTNVASLDERMRLPY